MAKTFETAPFNRSGTSPLVCLHDLAHFAQAGRDHFCSRQEVGRAGGPSSSHPAAEIDRIGAGGNNPTGMLAVAMLQNLVSGDQVEALVAGYSRVLIDECRHVPAVSIERGMREVKGNAS